MIENDTVHTITNCAVLESAGVYQSEDSLIVLSIIFCPSLCRSSMPALASILPGS